jgi:sulfite reductase (NADPH) flavoprotein alpha-component
MLRKIHSLTGLLAGVFVTLLAVTGAILATNPALERWRSSIPPAGELSVADLTRTVARLYPGAEQIERRASGAIVVYYTDGERTAADIIHAVTGKSLGPWEPSAFTRQVKNLHRAFLLGDTGRAVAGVCAAILAVLTLSGAVMLAVRQGGWRWILQPVRGTTGERLHSVLGRFAIIGLLISSLTGLTLSAVTFGYIVDGMEAEPDYPQTVDADAEAPAPAPVWTLAALQSTDLRDLRELVYPAPADPAGVFSLQTAQGAGYIDQATGAFLSWLPHNLQRRLYEWLYSLHTGEGLWWLGLLLGFSALTVPVMTLTGVQIWWKRRLSLPRLADNSRPDAADTIILVGSESNSTWGFAGTLHDALTKAGYQVHTASMNHLRTRYRKATRLLVLTSTYGAGDAPASARQFMARLPQFGPAPDLQFAVLGFGDCQYPTYCQFARETEAALQAKGLSALLPFSTINRQSVQEFAVWGVQLAAAIGLPLTLQHKPTRRNSHTLQLAGRVDYGVAVQAPTSIFRFTAQSAQPEVPLQGGWLAKLRNQLKRRRGLPHFEAGDLIGIYPPDDQPPRFYSLASASHDGVLEICVRQQPGGLCSGFLHTLQPGDSIRGFIQHNPQFRPPTGKAPVILIGAGTGIAPLAGFIRHNCAGRPMYLYWGGRSPDSDFLYETELKACLADRRLTQLQAAFSRVQDRAYVQDKLLADGPLLRRLFETNASILVCGGRDMAKSVRDAIDQVLAPLATSVTELEAAGRYREDVY